MPKISKRTLAMGSTLLSMWLTFAVFTGIVEVIDNPDQLQTLHIHCIVAGFAIVGLSVQFLTFVLILKLDWNAADSVTRPPNLPPFSPFSPFTA